MGEAFDVTSGTTESEDHASEAAQQSGNGGGERDLEPEQSDTARQDITDAATGLSRLLTEKCGTCIFRPGDLMSLGPAYLATLVRDALQKGTYIVCHDTLTYSILILGQRSAEGSSTRTRIKRLPSESCALITA